MSTASGRRPGTFAEDRGMVRAAAPGKIPKDLSKLEDRAAKVLEPEALAYILAGAGDRDTTRANARGVPALEDQAAQRARRPAKVDLSTTILGTRMPAPVLFAPIGVQTLAHPDGDLASARAAAELGLTYVHSTQGAYKMEDVAAANGDGSRWYQLYWPTDDELAVSFLRRAQGGRLHAPGHHARHDAARLAAARPGPRVLALPREQGHRELHERPGLPAPHAGAGRRRPGARPASRSPGVFQNPGLSWEQLPLIRANWDGPILLKGIQSPRDARLAVKHEIDGIVVSNHGGRQVDGAIASLDALRRSSRRSATRCPCSSTPGSARAATPSRRWRSAPTRCSSAGRTCTASRWTGRRGARSVMRRLVDELEDGRSGRPATAVTATLSRSSLTRAR